MSDFFILKKIDGELHKAIRQISFYDINPINISQEEKKVQKDPDYNPYFIYPKKEINYESVQNALNSIDEHNSALGNILNKKRNLFIDKSEMFNSRGSKKFSVFARKVYGLPSKEVLDRSASLLSLESKKYSKVLNSRTALHMIQAEINHHGFDYQVQEKAMGAQAMVLVSQKKIFINGETNFSENFVRRLMIHEIGTHVLRAENGHEQPFKIFYHGFPNYLSTEEGLAVINEERFGLLNNENLKNYAARAIGVKMALKEDFSTIYNYLLGFFDHKTAFKITTRVKRGIADTSKPGGCPKDFVYMDGYMRVKEHIENGGSINDLYIGKIGIEHLNKISEISNLVKPRYLPKNQSFKSLLSF